jgi:UDP-N-acetylmuramoyl-L-alanyl-D-glutamate--2,6-diaminopimelate ligase
MERMNMQVTLKELLPDYNGKDVLISDIVSDSRQVKTGDLFVFDKGIGGDAEKFVSDARAKGAGLVVTNIAGVGDVQDPFPLELMAKFYAKKFPKIVETLTAVTGTNGKTSVSWFVMQLMGVLSKKNACLGTMGLFTNGQKGVETGYTSPMPNQLMKILSDLRDEKVSSVCLEASSHALALRRLSGIQFKVAAFTNLTPEHLDFHRDMEHYAVEKFRLFVEMLTEDGVAVLPVNKPEVFPLLAGLKASGRKVLTYGPDSAELVVRQVSLTEAGQVVLIKYADVQEEIELPLIGSFQAENIAAALGIVIALGADIKRLIKILPSIQAVPGRMQVIPAQSKNSPTVVVDYAHSTDALEKALQALRSHVKGKLYVVFGCGGNRDTSKREGMALAAKKYADVAYITDDNPRDENPEFIRSEVHKHHAQAHNIAGREEAICAAIKSANFGDVVLVAGKGHETGQIVGDQVLPMNDIKTCTDILGEAS